MSFETAPQPQLPVEPESLDVSPLPLDTEVMDADQLSGVLADTIEADVLPDANRAIPPELMITPEQYRARVKSEKKEKSAQRKERVSNAFENKQYLRGARGVGRFTIKLMAHAGAFAMGSYVDDKHKFHTKELKARASNYISLQYYGGRLKKEQDKAKNKNTSRSL